MPNSPQLLVLLGSVTPPGRMHRVLGDAIERANAGGSGDSGSDEGAGRWSLLDLGTLSVGFADGTPIDQLEDDSGRLVEAVRAADGVLIGSPVYRASLTGSLKNALDLLPVDVLQTKPVGILAMGGGQQHFLGVASHLRDVLAWFGAMVAPTDVYLTSGDFTEGIATAEAATEVDELLATVSMLASSLAGEELGPRPLAARY